MRGRRRNADALGIDHFAHDTSRAVRRADENLGLRQTKILKSAGFEDFRRGYLLQTAEECIAPRVRAGEEDAQPAQGSCEKRIELACFSKGDSQRRVQASI